MSDVIGPSLFRMISKILWSCNRIKCILPDLIVIAIVKKMLGV